MKEHRLYAQARSQLLSRAAVSWMKHVIGLVAGSPDGSQLPLLCLQKAVIDTQCMACVWGTSMAYISRCSLYCVQLLVGESLALTHILATVQILEDK